jgi:fucose 4-O-acetylase-like acetyltransferase
MPVESRIDPRPGHAPSATRLEWIDAVRGVGIVLVAFGHVWRGLDSSALIGDPALFALVDRLIYAFHMPLFFFLSGFLFNISGTQPFTGMLVSRLTRLIWPLCLWTWIYFLFKAAIGGLANNPLPWAQFPILPLPPREQFWFLWALFLIQIGIALLLLLLKPISGKTLGLAVLTGLSLWLSLEVPTPEHLGPWTVGAMLNAPFVVLGLLVRKFDLATGPRPLGWLWLAVFVLVEMIAVRVTGSRSLDLAVGLVATLAVVLAIRALPVSAQEARWYAWLSLLGTASMAIYVSHVIFGAATRIGLKHAGVTDLGIHLFAGVAASILMPLALYLAARRLGLIRWVGF